MISFPLSEPPRHPRPPTTCKQSGRSPEKIQYLGYLRRKGNMSSSMSDTKKTVPGESLGIGTKTEMIPAIQHELLHSCSVVLWRRHVAFPFKIISSVLEESNLNLLVGCTYVVLLLVRDTGWTVWKFCLRRLHGHCMLSKNCKFFKMINSQSRKGSFTSPHFHWFLMGTNVVICKK
jgi:hypothetical protein